MSYQLVIAEKPSVARSIAGVIGATEKHDGYLQGNGYLVSWCIGHLVSFADAGRYDERFKKWRYEDLPILPETWQYIIPDEKKQQFDMKAVSIIPLGIKSKYPAMELFEILRYWLTLWQMKQIPMIG